MDEQKKGPDTPWLFNITGETLYGWRVNGNFLENLEEAKIKIETYVNMEMHDDDVIVAAFPKCGTHWLFEVVKMLRKGEATIDVKTKENVMMEFVAPEVIEKEQSPRTLNSHMPMCHLPKQIKEKKVKIIHVIRNPKDTLVSFFHFLKTSIPMTFDVLLEHTIANDMYFAHQFDYLRQMQKYQKDNSDVPIMNIYYEVMKKNPLQTTIEIAKFLGLDVTDQFCQDVVNACSFENMKAHNSSRKRADFVPKEDKTVTYRKGQVGDWKNNFTVAQNEVFDAFIEKESKGLEFKFMYV